MFKRIAIVVLIVAIASSLVWLYFYAKRITTPPISAFNAIPEHSCLIIETRNIKKSWEKFSENKVWKQLLSIDKFERFNEYVNKLNLTVSNDNEMASLIQKQPAFLCFHITEKKNLSYLVLINLPSSLDQESLKNFLAQLIPQEKEMPAYFFVNGILGISYSQELIALSQKAIKEKKSIVNNPDFKKIMFTAGKKVDENIFVNYPELAKMIRLTQGKTESNNIDFISKIGTFGSLDFKADSNFFSFVGYSTGNSNSGFSSVLAHTSSQKLNGIHYLPASLINLSYYGLNDFKKFRNAFLGYYSDTIATNKTSDELVENVSSWMGNELISFTYGIEAGRNPEAILCKLKYPENSEKNIVDAFRNQSEKNEVWHRSVAIRKFESNAMWLNLMGKNFSAGGKPYFCFVDDYVFFAESVEDLKYIINAGFDGKTLKNESTFKSFNDNLPAAANYFFCLKSARENAYLQDLLMYSHYKSFQANYKSLKNPGYYGFLMSENKNFYFTQCLAQFNSITRKTIPALNINFEYRLSSKIIPVKNTRAEVKYTLLQDEKNNVFVYDLTGKKLSQFQIKDKVKEVAFVTDEKAPTLVFSGNSAVYAVSLDGDMRKGFPIKLKSPLSSPISLFDYDNIKEYRLLFACENKKAYNYNLEGKPVEGWKMETGLDKIVCPITHFTVKGTDYLIMVDAKNTVRISGRHNEKVLQFSSKPEYFYRSSFYVERGPTMEKSCIAMSDTAGRICRLYFGGKTETDMLSMNWGSRHLFVSANINDDDQNEYLIANGKLLSAYTPEGDLLFETAFDKEIETAPQVFNLSNEYVICVNLLKTEQTFLLNNKGEKLYPRSIYTASPLILSEKSGEWQTISLNGNTLNFAPVK